MDTFTYRPARTPATDIAAAPPARHGRAGRRGACAAAVLLVIAIAPASGQDSTMPPHAWPVDELKRVYLECSSSSLEGRLPTTQAMHCSVVYEALKQRAFGGDFARLLAWSRAQSPSTHALGAEP